MFIRAIKISALLLFFGIRTAIANGLEAFERTCSDLGFKSKTVAYGECVLELHQRSSKGQNPAVASVDKPPPATSQTSQGDGTKAHNACMRYGFIIDTQGYAECRLKLDIAQKDAQEKQLKYEADQAEYKRQLAIREAEEKKRQSDKLIRMGLNMMSSKSSNVYEAMGDAGRAELGLPPQAPSRPTIQTYTITSPTGKLMTCTSVGNNINCF
jgi:hypothetical protein